MEEEFLLLQSITLQDFDDSQLSEATIETDEDGDAKTYRIDILWYRLFTKKIAGISKRNFETLFKLGKVVFSLVHSNAKEESLFSRVRKKLGLHKGQVFNLMEHCQASCPSSRAGHMVNHAINITHRLTLLKRLRLSPGNITTHIHHALKS